MKNYIFGTGAFAAEVAKRLDKFGIEIESFINIRDKNKEIPNTVYNNIPAYYVENVEEIDKNNSNIIIAKKPMFMGSAIDYLRKNNFKNVYAVNEEIFFSEQETKDELLKYFDRINLEKPFLNYLEINIVDQCNLNCKGCAHFSNICDNKFVNLENYKRDLELIAEKFYLYNFRLLGGEPLLHPKLPELVEITRNILPNSRIIIVTNGLLINKLSENALKKLSKSNVIVSISLYEPTFKMLDSIINKLNQYNINYLINDDYFKKTEVIEKFHTRLSTTRSEEAYLANQRCSGRFCRFLRDGKISKCYYPLLIELLNKKSGMNFEVSKEDYIELKDIVNGWDAIEKMNGDIPFCEYCREYLDEFNREAHHKNDNDYSSYVLKKRM